MRLKKALGDEILAFCKLNGIEDASAFLNKIVEAGFNLEKYGVKPQSQFPEIKTPTGLPLIPADQVEVRPLGPPTPIQVPPDYIIKSEPIKRQTDDDDYELYD